MKIAWIRTMAAILVAAGALFLRGHLPAFPLFPDRPAVRIAEPDYMSFALVRIAHQRGFFRDQKLQVEIVPAPSGRDALELVMAGKADFAACAGTPLAFAVLDGHDIVVLTGVSTVDGAHAIVAPRGEGIRSPFDLRGRTVAVPARTTSEFFLDRFLDLHGIPRRSVKRMNGEVADIEQMLLDRKVSAICTFRPWALPGNKYVRLGGDGIYSWNSFLVGRRSVVDQSPEVVEKILAALVKAEAHAVSRRQKLAGELAGSYGMEKREFETVSNSLRFGVTLDHAMLRGLEDEGRWAAEQRSGGSATPDFLNVFYFKGLSAVRPDSVTIVHNAPEPS